MLDRGGVVGGSSAGASINGSFLMRVHHDGRGIVQADFEKLNKSNVGLGLKNISSRLKVAQGSILFEKDASQTYYKITVEIPRDDSFESLSV